MFLSSNDGLVRAECRTSAYEQLKDLEWLIGDQVGEYNVQEGWEEFAPVGTKITRQVSVRWALNKSIMVAQITSTSEGRAPVVSSEIASWDPKAKQIVHSIYSPDGNGSGVWSKDGDEWLLQWTNATAKEVVYSGTSRMRKTGADTSVWRVTDCTKDGRKIADIPVVNFHQVPGKQSGKMPEEYRKALASLVGRWTVEGTENGKQVSAEYDNEWALDQHCIESRVTWKDADGVATCSGVIGWDALKKQLVVTEYWSHGACTTLCFTVAPSGIWTGTNSGADNGGRTIQGKIRLEIRGNDEMVFTAVDATDSPDTKPGSQLHFRRR